MRLLSLKDATEAPAPLERQWLAAYEPLAARETRCPFQCNIIALARSDMLPISQSRPIARPYRSPQG